MNVDDLILLRSLTIGLRSESPFRQLLTGRGKKNTANQTPEPARAQGC